jgi:two-component system phosphate regulon response regulator PhoB
VREAPRILLVGPTRPWHDKIREQLRTAELEVASSGDEARALARDWRPDVVVSEILLDDMTGMAFVRSLREDPELRHLRALVVSAQQSELDRVLAFECGADDFLPEPFSPRELAARVNALLRREPGSRAAPGTSVAEQHGVLVIEGDIGRVEVAGRPVRLTPTEFRVLALLIVGQGKVLSRRTIVEGIAGDAATRSARVVDAHVKSLRRKLGEARAYVQSVRGVGYRFAVPGR